jgi:hypothetical protein
VFELGRGLSTGSYPSRGVLATVGDKETEVKRSVSRMPSATRATGIEEEEEEEEEEEDDDEAAS